MPDLRSPQIITANDLLDGDVIFLTADHDWSRVLAAAAIADTPEQAQCLLDIAAKHSGRVVEPYSVDVQLNAAGAPTPTHYREHIRTLGPTNRPDLGRQAQGLGQLDRAEQS